MKSCNIMTDSAMLVFERVALMCRCLCGAEAELARRRRPGGSGGPAPSPPRRAAHLPRRQSTATRRPGDLCSVHDATLSTLSRALCDVSRFSRTLSIPLPRGDPALPQLIQLEFRHFPKYFAPRLRTCGVPALS